VIAWPSKHPIAEFLPVVSLSGGKDSTATALALREAEIPAVYVFADTGWEADSTYIHLNYLETALGQPIHRVRPARSMVEAIRHRVGFPSRVQRWCTRELKIKPINHFLQLLDAWSGLHVVNVVGVRAQESRSRATLPEWEEPEELDGCLWRPLIRWTLEEVIAIHNRHGVEVGPLYRAGHERVGCYPCIFAAKEEIRLVAERAPERVEVIRQLEAEITAERSARNVEQPGRHKHERATFFQGGRLNPGPVAIDDVIAWSRTVRGGRQLPLIAEPPTGGCFRWGLCEPPRKGSK